MNWKKIKCILLYKDIAACEEFFLSNEVDQIVYYEMESKTIHSEDDDLWCFEAYVSSDFVVPSNIEHLNLISTEEEELGDENWMLHSEYIREPIIMEEFYIYNDFIKNAKQIPIILNSSMAFGTGEHGSTQGCLQGLANLKLQPINSVLDIGAGSGILAIAARKIFPTAEVFGVDIDEDAVNIASSHAELNNVSAQFFTVEKFNDLYKDKTFDLIFANIFANTIVELYDYIVSKKPNFIVMSGFFNEQVLQIMEIYKSHYVINLEISINEWITLILKHKDL